MSVTYYNVNNDIILNIRIKYFEFRHTDLLKAAASDLRLSVKACRLFLAAVVYSAVLSRLTKLVMLFAMDLNSSKNGADQSVSAPGLP